MDYLKQLGLDFIELLLINGARSNRFIFICSFISALSLIFILMPKDIVELDFISNIIFSIFSIYLIYAVISKRAKDISISSNSINICSLALLVLTPIFLGPIIFIIILLLVFLILAIIPGTNNINDHGSIPSTTDEYQRLKMNSVIILITLILLQMVI